MPLNSLNLLSVDTRLNSIIENKNPLLSVQTLTIEKSRQLGPEPVEVARGSTVSDLQERDR